MGFWDNMNGRIKKMTVTDIGLVKWSVFFTTIIIVKLFPQLLKISYVVLFMLMVACSIKPLYSFWIKSDRCKK
jgi:heme/copper-type cytochrome/quinol oxidase subunit 1